MYNVGDLVCVLPYEEIVNKFARGDILPSGCHFTTKMGEFCEKTFEIGFADPIGQVGYYRLKEIGGEQISWWWTDEMLSSADEPDVLEIYISFDDLLR